MKKVSIPLGEFIKQLQKIQADMAGKVAHPNCDKISFYLHSENKDETGSVDVSRLSLCEDQYDPAIECDYNMGCRCTLGAVINLIEREKD